MVHLGVFAVVVARRVCRGDISIVSGGGSGSVAKPARGRHARVGMRQRQSASPDGDTQAAVYVALSVQGPRVSRCFVC